MTSIADRESLQSVLTKINGLFDDTVAADARLSAVEATSDGNSTAIGVLDTRVDAAETTISANTADIATNTADISTNTADIATNTADIAVLNERTNNGIPGTVTSKSSGFTAVAVDRGRVFHITATLTASLTTAATLADGWYADFYVETGTLTIDPAGAETISGASTLSVTAGRSVRVVCDGSAFYAVGLTIGTDSPTFTGTTTVGGITVNTTGTMRLPVGTTAQRPGSPSAGDFRYNSTTGYPDIYNGSAWRTATVNEAAAITGGTINGTSVGATTPAAVTASTLNLSGSSVGDVFYHNGTSIVRLAAGTSGQFLKSNGAAAPSWATLSTSSRTLIDTKATTSGATVVFSGLSLSGYSAIEFVFDGVSGTTATGSLTINTGNGAVVISAARSSAGQLHFGILRLDVATGAGSGTIGAHTSVSPYSTSIEAAGMSYGHGGSISGVTSITMGNSGGNFDAGQIKLYGIT